MSADSFHHQVEQNIKQRKKLYDFKDFVACVGKSGIAEEMSPLDFFDFQNNLSSAKDTNYPYLRDIAVVVFKRGETKMYWKQRHSDQSFKSGEFLTKKFRDQVNKCRPIHQKSGPRGVNSLKLDDIISKLLPLMPPTYKIFWQNLTSSAEAKDLTINYDHLSRKEKQNKDTPEMPGKKRMPRSGRELSV